VFLIFLLDESLIPIGIFGIIHGIANPVIRFWDQGMQRGCFGRVADCHRLEAVFL
jgi:hypothetical protein